MSFTKKIKIETKWERSVFIKKNIIIFGLILLSSLISNYVYATPMGYALEVGIGYDFIIIDTEILYTGADYSIDMGYLNFPMGISIAYSNIEGIYLAIDFLYEQRKFTRNTIYIPPMNDTLTENFNVIFNILHFSPIMRVFFLENAFDNIFSNIFIGIGFSMNLILTYEFSGTYFSYSNELEESPNSDEIEVINIKHNTFNSIGDVFERVDFSFAFETGWKNYLTNKTYFLCRIRYNINIIDIDKSYNYKTFFHSIFVYISIGVHI